MGDRDEKVLTGKEQIMKASNVKLKLFLDLTCPLRDH